MLLSADTPLSPIWPTRWLNYRLNYNNTITPMQPMNDTPPLGTLIFPLFLHKENLFQIIIQVPLRYFEKQNPERAVYRACGFLSQNYLSDYL